MYDQNMMKFNIKLSKNEKYVATNGVSVSHATAPDPNGGTGFQGAASARGKAEGTRRRKGIAARGPGYTA